MQKLLLVIIAAFLFTGCSLGPTANQEPTQEEIMEVTEPVNQEINNQEVSTNPSLKITVTSNQDGLTVEQILDAMGVVEYQDFGNAGKFVKSINGVDSNNENYWTFYLNGKISHKRNR